MSLGHVIVGAYLRAVRTHRNLTLHHAATLIDVSTAKISRFENGLHQPSADHVHRLAAAYGLTCTPCRTHLTQLLTPTEESTVLHDTQPGHHTRRSAAETGATSLLYYTTQLIPAPFQTNDYRAALPTTESEHTHPDAHPQLPTTPTPTHRPTTLFLDESILHRTLVPPHTLAHQLHTLHRLSYRTHYTVRIVPFAAGPTHHPGTLTEINRPHHRLYAHHTHHTTWTTTPPHTLLHHLHTHALTPDTTRHTLRQAADRLTHHNGRRAVSTVRR
ncbi:Scr1 family TA system antitoxin-like transcriptional regulator [Streptomyces sp. DSM 44915]|uniref:Scr1 family TA system antitoxin-like transcriptional regulator n=1 Tax=Streptomyces chisholmiae TaxID=3075540 RepID=A0ABU2JPI6_9ACTN|nr:Scr1 family TA system antitoxin-like transcriptional regulator [Streptomyces sp. DSM 44915]MDT0266895.1 Scr1 family TA system antitoxin-like transcriptional regulator [Streptomyces sp. DSM 44915]